MKKLYIILAVAFVFIAAGLIYFGNTGTNSENSSIDDVAVKKKMREELKQKGGIKPDKIFLNRNRKQMDKKAMKRLMMIRKKDRDLKSELDEKNSFPDEQKKVSPVEPAEKK